MPWTLLLIPIPYFYPASSFTHVCLLNIRISCTAPEKILPQAKSLSRDHKKPKYAHGLAVIIFISPSLQCKSYWLCNVYIYFVYSFWEVSTEYPAYLQALCNLQISTNENKLKSNTVLPSIPP